MIIIEVDDRSVMNALRQLQVNLSDMTPAMNSIGMEFEARVSRRFEDESDPKGRLWAPWKPATRNSYPKDGNAHILDRYGDMLDSLNYQADKGSVMVGFGVPYAAFHEYGTKKMARRGMLFSDPSAGSIGEEDRRSILDIISTYLSL